jgi:methylmalonyl-CoA/ethylmalonyl-CoA epimerase
MKIHHIGYCVNNIDKSILEFEKIGYERFDSKFNDIDRKIYIQFMKNGNMLVELVSPTNEGESSIDGILKKIGDTAYHICYEVEDINDEIEKLKQEKYILINQPQGAIAINSYEVAFLYKRNVGLIELVEIKK